MKNAIIFHGTLGSPKGNWFQWLKNKLMKKGWKVWVPKLPVPNKPRITRSAKYVLRHMSWQLNSESVLIGHSSGPAVILGILSMLPNDIVVKKCIFVGAFTKSDWEPNSEFFDCKFDFPKIKKKAKEFILIHADNDPYTPLKQAENLSRELGGELIVKHGQGHFNLEARKQYKQFPFILELLEEK
jgi:hypothetical protein